jgi:hypothetical protein
MTPGSVAMDALGNYVVVWTGQDSNGAGVYAQRYSSLGLALGGAFQVNTTTTNEQTNPTVAMTPDGRFVVTWSSYNSTGYGWGVYAQRYAADGTALGGQFRVNTTIADDQMYSSVAMDANGDFVIAWQSNNQDGDGWGVYAQRYNADGTTNGGEFQVNTTTAGDQANPAVAMDANGDFVIAWQSNNQDGDGWGVYAQRYNADGTANGGEFRVNTTTAGDQVHAAVAINSSTGAFVITWASNGQDGGGSGIYAQRYNADGTAAGGEFRVNTTTAGDQAAPAATMDANSNLVISWSSNSQDGSGWGVFAQQYDGTGAPVGSEFRVNTTTAGDEQFASITMDNTGDAVAVWSGTTAGSTSGVYGQRFLLNGASGLAGMSGKDAVWAQGDPVLTAAAATSTTLTSTIQASGHPNGCACGLCQRLAKALGITNADAHGGSLSIQLI